MSTVFIIKAAKVDMEKASKIAEVLFPEVEDIRVESITNDENTLTFEEYQWMYTYFNDILVAYIKEKRILYQDIADPYYVRFKNICEKMKKRIGQFQQISV